MYATHYITRPLQCGCCMSQIIPAGAPIFAVSQEYDAAHPKAPARVGVGAKTEGAL